MQTQSALAQQQNEWNLENYLAAQEAKKKYGLFQTRMEPTTNAMFGIAQRQPGTLSAGLPKVPNFLSTTDPTQRVYEAGRTSAEQVKANFLGNYRNNATSNASRRGLFDRSSISTGNNAQAGILAGQMNATSEKQNLLDSMNAGNTWRAGENANLLQDYVNRIGQVDLSDKEYWNAIEYLKQQGLILSGQGDTSSEIANLGQIGNTYGNLATQALNAPNPWGDLLKAAVGYYAASQGVPPSSPTSPGTPSGPDVFRLNPPAGNVANGYQKRGGDIPLQYTPTDYGWLRRPTSFTPRRY